jgi:type I restriction enzyme R subunit
VQVIEELIALAREMKAAGQRGEALGLSDDELAFYDALGINDSAVRARRRALKQIARELTETIRGSVTIDWTVKETVRAKLRTLVRRKLRQHGYPPGQSRDAPSPPSSSKPSLSPRGGPGRTDRSSVRRSRSGTHGSRQLAA